jgi:hypothetical protein
MYAYRHPETRPNLCIQNLSQIIIPFKPQWPLLSCCSQLLNLLQNIIPVIIVYFFLQIFINMRNPKILDRKILLEF